MRMRAAVLHEVGKPLVLQDITLDPPRAGEVLVRVRAAGICHSDLHYATGQIPRPVPLLLGHEGAGEIVQTGADVTSVRSGDHVVLTFLPSCGRCRWCATGEPTLCELSARLRDGTMLDGTRRLHTLDGRDIDNLLFIGAFAEYAVVPEASVVRVPDDVAWQELCLFGCAFTTGFGSATRAVPLGAGDTVAVVGCGGVGLACIEGAALAGAAQIIAVDVQAANLDRARRFGATDTVRAGGDVLSVVRQISELTGGLGVDYAFEFVGGAAAPDTIATAYHAARKGGTVCIGGLAAASLSELPISPLALVTGRKTIRGVLFGNTSFRVDIGRYVDLHRRGRLKVAELISRTLPLEDINEGIQEVLDGGSVARVVVVP